MPEPGDKEVVAIGEEIEGETIFATTVKMPLCTCKKTDEEP
jgi:hypothetical protein